MAFMKKYLLNAHVYEWNNQSKFIIMSGTTQNFTVPILPLFRGFIYAILFDANSETSLSTFFVVTQRLNVFFMIESDVLSF